MIYDVHSPHFNPDEVEKRLEQIAERQAVNPLDFDEHSQYEVDHLILQLLAYHLGPRSRVIQAVNKLFRAYMSGNMRRLPPQPTDHRAVFNASLQAPGPAEGTNLNVSAPSQRPNYTQVALERIEFCVRAAISHHLLADCHGSNHLDMTIDHATGDLVVTLTAGVWGETSDATEREYSWPANWKEAFKDRWFKGWMRKCWPTQHTEKHFTVKALYPGFQPQAKGMDYRLVIMGG
jgi:hypothetical protein